jgi:hypothetical protein
MALTHHGDIEVMPGDDWIIPGVLLDANGNPLDLSDCKLSWALVGPDGNGVAVAEDAVDLEITDAAARPGSPSRWRSPSPSACRLAAISIRCGSPAPTRPRFGSAAFWSMLARSWFEAGRAPPTAVSGHPPARPPRSRRGRWPAA